VLLCCLPRHVQVHVGRAGPGGRPSRLRRQGQREGAEDRRGERARGLRCQVQERGHAHDALHRDSHRRHQVRLQVSCPRTNRTAPGRYGLVLSARLLDRTVWWR
jgi:hypothetical protein